MSLRSKLPKQYSDEEWTDLVFDRLRNNYPGDMLDMMLVNPFDVVQKDLVEQLSEEEVPSFEPKLKFIDYRFAPADFVSAYDAERVRIGLATGMSMDSLMDAFSLTRVQVLDVLSGKVWPCSGGPLLPVEGAGLYLNPDLRPPNKEMGKVIAGVLALAAEVLKPREFQLLVEQNGLSVMDAHRIIPGAQADECRYTFHRQSGGLPKTKIGRPSTR